MGSAISRATSVGAAHASEIADAADRFGDHEGISPAHVLAWLLQFADDDLPLALKVLSEVHYFNATNLRLMTRRILEIAEVDFQAFNRDRTLFVPISTAPGGGAETVARILRSQVEPFTPRVMTMVDLASADPDTIDTVVFVDDFAGTGDTLDDWWGSVETLILPLGVVVVVAALVMSTGAVERAKAFAKVLVVREMGPDTNVLGPDCEVFDESEKDKMLDYCRTTLCSGRFLRGFGELGLLLAFTHGCPNNSLPILWCTSRQWKALFLRRAI